MSDWNLDLIADRLQQAALDVEIWPDVLTDLSKAVGGAGAVLLSTDCHLINAPFSASLERVHDDYFKNQWNLRDERDKGIPKLLRRGVVSEHEFLSRDDMNKSAFYRDFIERHGYRWFAAVGFMAANDLWCVSIQRKIGQDPFQPDELKRLSNLWRPLSDAATLSRQLGFARVLGISDALDMMKQPAILLDARGRVLVLNKQAEHYVGDTIDIAKRTIKFEDTVSQYNFDSMIARALVGDLTDACQPETTRVKNQFGGQLIIRAITLREWAKFTFTNARILLLFDQPNSSRLEQASYKTTFGFTAAETRLANELCAGQSVAQAAEKLGVTYGTARSYLRSIFAKTETNRQGQLVALLLQRNYKVR